MSSSIEGGGDETKAVAPAGLTLEEIPESAVDPLVDLIDHRCDTIVNIVRQAGSEAAHCTMDLYREIDFLYKLLPQENPTIAVKITAVVALLTVALHSAYEGLPPDLLHGLSKKERQRVIEKYKKKEFPHIAGVDWEVFQYKDDNDNDDSDDSDDEEERAPKTKTRHDKEKEFIPLVQWNLENWTLFSRTLNTLADLLADEFKKQQRISALRDGKDFEKVKLLLRVHKHMARLDRWELERKLRCWDETQPLVESDRLEAFRKSAAKESETKVKRALEGVLDLFTTNPPESTLAQLEDMSEVVSKTPFELHRVRGRITQLLISWYEECFGQNPSLLVCLGYGDEEKETAARRTYKSKEQIQQLRTARTTLREETVDPLPEALDAARGAQRRRPRQQNDHHDEDDDDDSSPRERKRAKGDMYAKRPSASRIRFDDSEEESDPEDEHVRLSDLPRRAPPSHAKKSLSSGLVSPTRKRCGGRRRKPYTKEECQAIKDGVRKYGKGNWVDIKAAYSFVLSNRSSVDIKDKYRNMLTRGDVVESEEE